MKGIKVSPTGVDAQKANIKDLLYTTEAKSLKIREYGTITFNFTITETITAIVTHNTINYIPAYRVYVETVPGSGNWYSDAFFPGGITATTDAANAATWGTQISSTAIEVILAGFAGYKYKARYFIFEDQIT